MLVVPLVMTWSAIFAHVFRASVPVVELSTSLTFEVATTRVISASTP